MKIAVSQLLAVTRSVEYRMVLISWPAGAVQGRYAHSRATDGQGLLLMQFHYSQVVLFQAGWRGTTAAMLQSAQAAGPDAALEAKLATWNRRIPCQPLPGAAAQASVVSLNSRGNS